MLCMRRHQNISWNGHGAQRGGREEVSGMPKFLVGPQHKRLTGFGKDFVVLECGFISVKNKRCRLGNNTYG